MAERCAMQTWWSSGWQSCKSKATEGRYCVGHAWANKFPPLWDGGSLMGGSLLHRTTPQVSPVQETK